MSKQLREFCAFDKDVLKLQECVDAFFRFSTNDGPVRSSLNSNLTRLWERQKHPMGNTEGLSFYIEIPDLPRGKHTFYIDTPVLATSVNKSFWYYPQ